MYLHKSNIKELETQVTEYEALDKLLGNLVEKLEQPCMVPLGDLAFVPGSIYHTNEITVYLGEEYHVEMSSKNAREIIVERKRRLNSSINDERKKLNDVYTKYGLTKDLIGKSHVSSQVVDENAELFENENGEIEIREKYVETNDQPRKKKSILKHEPVFEDDKEIEEMMRKLQEEEDAEEQDFPKESVSTSPEVIQPDLEEFNKFFNKKVTFKDEPNEKRNESAFTGKIVEKSTPTQEIKEEPKKVSRFKQQRQNQ